MYLFIYLFLQSFNMESLVLHFSFLYYIESNKKLGFKTKKFSKVQISYFSLCLFSGLEKIS